MRDLLLIVLIIAAFWFAADSGILNQNATAVTQPQTTYTIQEPPTPQPVYVAPTPLPPIQQVLPTAVPLPAMPPLPTAVPQPQVIIVQQEAPPVVQPTANTIYIEVTPGTWFADGIRAQNTLKAQTGIGHPECHAPMICD